MASPYKMTGKITRISDIKNITETFSIKEFILLVDEGGKYPQEIKFQLNRKYFDIVYERMVGKNFEVSFFINGRATKSGYFNTLSAVDVQPIQAAPPASPKCSCNATPTRSNCCRPCRPRCQREGSPG